MPPSNGGVEAFVALGSNLGNREALLRAATASLQGATGVAVVAASRVYESPAHTRPPHAPQPPYLNAVLRLRTMRSPAALVRLLLATERRCGRERSAAWAPRTLDLDLLLWGGRQLDTPLVMLPHPRMALRRFVLQPLADVAPDRVVPGTEGATVQALLARCPDADALVLTDIDLLDSIRP